MAGDRGDAQAVALERDEIDEVGPLPGTPPHNTAFFDFQSCHLVYCSPQVSYLAQGT
jgi:hypothetical protein